MELHETLIGSRAIAMPNKTKLRDVLKEQGRRQDWLAREIRMTENNVSRIVNGKVVPSLHAAVKIARALNTTVEDLWGHEVDYPPRPEKEEK